MAGLQMNAICIRSIVFTLENLGISVEKTLGVKQDGQSRLFMGLVRYRSFLHAVIHANILRLVVPLPYNLIVSNI